MGEHDRQRRVALRIVIDRDALDQPIIRQRPLREHEHLRRRERDLPAYDAVAEGIVRIQVGIAVRGGLGSDDGDDEFAVTSWGEEDLGDLIHIEVIEPLR